MAAKKITKRPSGISFKHTPAEPYPPLTHTWPLDPHHDCEGEIVLASGGFPTCNEHATFICTGCDWISPDGYVHEPTKVTKVPKPKPRKKQKPNIDPAELRDAVNAECRKRMARLVKERAKFPPTFIEAREKATHGPDKGKLITVLHDNPDFTDNMREQLHKLSFTAEEVRAELKGV
jgi:hypothetical protein